ncbi:exocyst complex component EXO70B1 [Abrus precatorius]|uniref:Exocyst subunit Exo70 family protein n=1 Tax=Abrus precatorius TaxID=3816 RepID=A0A8B8MIR1_ABRPR|nr:exocyst complex component EXO70B1 [Abrus precatorius]
MDKSWSFAPRKSNVGSVLEDVDVPDCVGVLPKLLDKYESGRSKFGEEAEDDKSFLDALQAISKLCLCDTSLSALDAQEKAMSFLETELCLLLDHPKSKTPKKSFSFGSHPSHDSPVPDNDSPKLPPQDHHDHHANEDFPPNFSAQKRSVLKKIASAMIAAGYQTECCMAFAAFRRTAFKTALQRFGYRSVRMEDVYKMQWESLEGEIATWNKVVGHSTTVLFSAERRLYDSVFHDHPSISQNLFSDLVRAVIVHLLNFVHGAVLTKQSAEKLFKFLDMYETLRDVEPAITGASYSEQCAKELAYEVATAKDRVAEAVVGMFCDLENSIKSDNQRIPVPNGAVHPLTRYVMNYLEYACEYKDTSEQVFERCVGVKGIGIGIESHKSIDEEGDDGTGNKSAFALQFKTVMELLDANVERKSRLYKDPALRYVFLMNNGRYIVQKMKGCAELHKLMGDNWCRRRQSRLRLYHKCYQRETWSKVLQCLNPEGLKGNGNKVSKQLLKERFKSFNSMFEDIHKKQRTWMVSDEQLQSELRVSITALVIPAYRSFVGRFKHHLESPRHVDKYIKYHPDDIEIFIHHFFDGNAPSIPRKRT